MNTTDTINGKTPEEIKKGLECCMDYQSCVEYGEPKCPYNDVTRCMEALLADALAYSQQLESDNENKQKRIEELESRLAQAERERDACIADITQFQGVTCNACKHHYRPQPEVRHYECEIFGKFSDVFESEEGPLMCGKFEWRGPHPENTKEKE